MAKILGIESASLTASVALAEGNTLIAEYTLNDKKTHSQTLLPMIDEIVSRTDTDKGSIDAVAISKGPGSFTGLRIGSATAKGLGQALNIPLIPVPTLDAMAYGLYGCAGLICPMMDARRNQVYTGIYRNEGEFQVVLEQCPLDIHDLLDRLNQLGQPVIFLGDGVPVQKERIREELKVPCSFAPAHLSRQKAGAVAVLGAVYYEKGITQTAAEHAPEYLRMSQAEREMKEKGVSLP